MLFQQGGGAATWSGQEAQLWLFLINHQPLRWWLPSGSVPEDQADEAEPVKVLACVVEKGRGGGRGLGTLRPAKPCHRSYYWDEGINFVLPFNHYVFLFYPPNFPKQNQMRNPKKVHPKNNQKIKNPKNNQKNQDDAQPSQRGLLFGFRATCFHLHFPRQGRALPPLSASSGQTDVKCARLPPPASP